MGDQQKGESGVSYFSDPLSLFGWSHLVETEELEARV